MCGVVIMFTTTIICLLLVTFFTNESLEWKLPPAKFLLDFADTHGLVAAKVYLPSDLKVSLDVTDHFKTLNLMYGNIAPIPVTYMRQNTTFATINKARSKDLCIFIPDDQAEVEFFKGKMAKRQLNDSEVWLFDVSSWKDIESLTASLQSVQLDLDDDIFLYNVTEDRNGFNVGLHEAYKVQAAGSLIIQPLGGWGTGYRGPTGRHEMWIRRRDLRGMSFRARAITSPPYIMELIQQPDGSYKFTGMIPEIIQSLQEIMNFTLNLTKSPYRSWGSRSPNGTWNGLVGFLIDDVIDFAPQDITVTLERSEVIDFTEPFIQYYTGLFIKNPVGTYNLMAYIEPLHYLSWLFITLVCLVAPPVLAVSVRFGARDPYFEEFTLNKSYIFLLSILTTRGWSHSPETGASRFAFFSLLIFALMIYKHWEAMLVSYLATRVIVLPFTNVDTLVKDSSYRMSTNPGSLIVDKFRYATDPVWKEAWVDRMEPSIGSYEGDLASLLQFLMAESEMSLYTDFRKVSSTRLFIDCEIIATPAKYDQKPNAFGLPKNSPYLGVFNYYMRRMTQTGTLNKILTKFQSQPQVCPDYSGKALGMNSCFTAFFPIFFGVGVAFVLFFLELVSKCGRKMASSKKPKFNYYLN